MAVPLFPCSPEACLASTCLLCFSLHKAFLSQLVAPGTGCAPGLLSARAADCFVSSVCCSVSSSKRSLKVSGCRAASGGMTLTRAWQKPWLTCHQTWGWRPWTSLQWPIWTLCAARRASWQAPTLPFLTSGGYNTGCIHICLTFTSRTAFLAQPQRLCAVASCSHLVHLACIRGTTCFPKLLLC